MKRGRGKLRQRTLCDKRKNNIFDKIKTSVLFKNTDLFVKTMQKTTNNSRIQVSDSPVTFVTRKQFAILFFLP